MRRALVLFIGLLFGLITTGLALFQSRVLILVIPLLVYLFAAILQRPEDIQLGVQRQVEPQNAAQGEPMQVRLAVTNQGAGLDELVIGETFPEGMRKTGGQSALLTRLAAGAGVELAYTIQAERGQYDSYALSAVAGDPFGFFEVRRVFEAGPHLVIHPRYPRLERIKVRPPQTRGFAGPIAARQGGVGVDFYGVREYQYGDPQRQINWRMAARSDQELFTNVFEQERVADVGLILDARQRVDVPSPSGSLFEHSVLAAAALAENFLSDGNRVSLLVYGSSIESVFPGYGRIHKDRILKTLAKATPRMNYALDSLAYIPTRFFPAKSQIVMISPIAREDIPVLTSMRVHGYAVLVISPDPVSFASGMQGDFTSRAYRLAFAERDFMLQQLRRCGMQVVNWRVDQPLEAVVRDTLAHQSVVFYQNRLGVR